MKTFTLLISCLILSVCKVSAQNRFEDTTAQDFTVDNFKFRILSEKEAEVAISVGNEEFWNFTEPTHFDIPSKVLYGNKEYTVTAIDEEGFCPAIPTSLDHGYIPFDWAPFTIDVPNTVTHIGDWAFAYSGLAEIHLPESLEHIGFRCFIGDHLLESIHIPQNVSSIGGLAFYLCINLDAITVDPSNEHYDSRDNSNCLIETKTNTVLAGCNKSVLPQTIEAIQQLAFEDMERLQEISIPEGVTRIENETFIGCSGLTKIEFPESLKYIGQYTFSGCVNAIFELPCQVDTIDDCAFMQCRSVEELVFPESLDFIGGGAFYECRGVKNVTCKSKHKAPVVESKNAFDTKDGVLYTNAVLHVPDKKIYADKEGWKLFKNVEEFGDGPDGIADLPTGDISIKGCNGTIQVNGARMGSRVHIYSTNGHLVYLSITKESDTVIELPTQTAYIVVVDGIRQKILL